MSTDQQVKPRSANQSITDESARPGTLKSKVGCDAIDEPWTNNAAGLSSDVSTYFSQRKRRTSPLCVQCSLPVMGFTFVFVQRFMSKSSGSARDLPLIRVSNATQRCDSSSANPAGARIRSSLDLFHFSASGAHDFSPALLLGAEECSELGRRRADDLDARGVHVALHVCRFQHLRQLS